MARSKQVTKKVEKKAEAPLTTKKQNETPYQLDPAQVERAANALVAHMKKHKEEKEAVGTKDLLADEDEAEENDQPIFLSVSTKKHVNNTNSLKPTKMSVHTLPSALHDVLTDIQCPASPHHCERR
jgi:ribosome biogenesis protein UTP30